MKRLLEPLGQLDWRDHLSILGGTALLVLYVYQGHHSFFSSHLAPALGDSPTSRWYAQCYQFGSAFLLMAVIPALWFVLGKGGRLSDCGLAIGDWRFGLKAVALGFVLLPLPLYVNAGSPAFQAEYPLARMAGDSVMLFVVWELCYLVYYVAWEFFFRGFWQLGLRRVLGAMGAMALQTATSTIIHMGKPEPEIFSAIAGGVIFGLLVLRTRSIVYVILLHWYLGMATDLFCILRSP